MCPSNTGCLNEIAEQNRSGIYSFSEKYYDVIKNWISLLKDHNNNLKRK
jgi:hypothetical protein